MDFSRFSICSLCRLSCSWREARSAASDPSSHTSVSMVPVRWIVTLPYWTVARCTRCLSSARSVRACFTRATARASCHTPSRCWVSASACSSLVRQLAASCIKPSSRALKASTCSRAFSASTSEEARASCSRDSGKAIGSGIVRYNRRPPPATAGTGSGAPAPGAAALPSGVHRPQQAPEHAWSRSSAASR
eukprot:scaffold874_cov380-Prasinococcus_capsulatus_cf.AAC.3